MLSVGYPISLSTMYWSAGFVSSIVKLVFGLLGAYLVLHPHGIAILDNLLKSITFTICGVMKVITNSVDTMRVFFPYLTEISGHRITRCLSSVHFMGQPNLSHRLQGRFANVGRRQAVPRFVTGSKIRRTIFFTPAFALICVMALLVTTASSASAEICIVDLCAESTGGIAVFLTDTTTACAGSADNYLTSKCGFGYNKTTCSVDCDGIYSWHGSFWNAMGCSILGNPCGSQGECPASLSNACQLAESVSSSATTPLSGTASASSTAASVHHNQKAIIAGASTGGVVAFIIIFVFVMCMCFIGGAGAGGGGGGGGGGDSGTRVTEEELPPPGSPSWNQPKYNTPYYAARGRPRH